jgi:hypothetical protein
MSRKDQTLRIVAQLDVSPADADRWRQCKGNITRMMDGLGLAPIELESNVRAPEERSRMALRHVRFGLGVE